MMIKKFTKILCVALIGCSLVSLPANAKWKRNSTGWWYTEGKSYATGWRQIDGEWYFFKPDGYMVSNMYCEFNNEVGSYDVVPTECNGKIYYFDKDGHMLHDCYIVQGSGCFQYWLNSDGSCDYQVWGSKYSGFDLSQVK